MELDKLEGIELLVLFLIILPIGCLLILLCEFIAKSFLGDYVNPNDPLDIPPGVLRELTKAHKDSKQEK